MRCLTSWKALKAELILRRYEKGGGPQSQTDPNLKAFEHYTGCLTPGSLFHGL